MERGNAMDKAELLRRTTEICGVDQDTVERVYFALIQALGDALGQGEAVDLRPEWGCFMPKLSDNPSRRADSPRTPKIPRYDIRFRAGGAFEQKLKLP